MRPMEKAMFQYQQKLAGSIDNLVKILDVTYEGFLKHKKTLLHDAEKAAAVVAKFKEEFTSDIIKEGDKASVRLLIELTGEMDRIRGFMEGIIKTVNVKIKDNTLFSDRAVEELKYLFNSTKDLLTNLKDVVTTFNETLIKDMLSKGTKINEAADEYESQHAARLVRSLCEPKHSPLYLDILGNLRMVVWYVKEMSRKIQGF